LERYNGWGDKDVVMELPDTAGLLLRQLVGAGVPRRDCPLDEFLKKIPESRLDDHPLISKDPHKRMIHSHGQSLPDWVAMRSGTIGRFVDGVAFVNSEDDIREVIEFCIKNKCAIIPFGGGTSVVGHLSVPESERPVVSVSMKKMNRMLSIDPVSRIAVFEAGIRGPGIEDSLRPHGFTLGHFPQSFEYSSLGGWVVTRSSGQQSAHYGRIEKLFAGGSVITPRGMLEIPVFPASGAGPDIREMILGSEGRMGILSRVAVRISPVPEKDDFFGVFFPSWAEGVRAVREVSGMNLPVSMVRLSNPDETRTNLALASGGAKKILLDGYLKLRGISEESGCMCLFGLTGSRQTAGTGKNQLTMLSAKYGGVWLGTVMGDTWKKNRFRAPYLRNTLWDMGYAVDTLETAVTWDRVTDTMRDIESAIKGALEKAGERVHVFSHLSHVYSSGSSIYTSYIFRLGPTPEETLERWRPMKQAASRAIVENGGTITHQHGIGIDHRDYVEKEKGRLGVDMISSVCRGLDPSETMNPGKLVPPGD